MTRRSAAAALVLAGALASSGCGAARSAPSDPLRVRATSAVIDGDVRYEHLTFASPSGRRLAAVLVRPRAFAPRACLIWQNGLGRRSDDPQHIWHRAARLGLAVLTVDLPHDGVQEVTPLADLGRAVDLLERRPECRGTIGYAGLGLAGPLGAALAARDQRIRAAVLAAAPALDPARTVARIAPRPALVLASDPFARPVDAGAVFKVERFLLERLVRPTYG